MPFELPEFDDGMLESLMLCGMYCDADEAHSDALSAVATRLVANYKSSGGPIVVALLIQGGSDGHGHFHVDIGKKDCLEWIRDSTDYQHVTITELRKTFTKLHGLPLSVRASGDFVVPAEAMPKRGIVTTLLGLPTRASGVAMAISGVEMVVQGDPFTGVKFGVGDESSYDVSVEFNSRVTLQDDYLVQFARLARQGLELLVFESPRATTDASTGPPKKKRIKKAGGA